MEFIYKIKPTRSDMLRSGTTDEEDNILEKHFNYLNELWDEKVVFCAGRTLTEDEDSFGIVIFYAENMEKAKRIMKNDPAVNSGLMSATLYPFSIALS